MKDMVLSGMSWISSWVGKSPDETMTTAAVLTLIVSIVGFAFAIVQLNKTQRALRASNTYAIQKDGRDLVDALRKDDAFRSYVLEHEVSKKYDEPQIRTAKQSMALVFNFYLSVFRQMKAGGISKSLAGSMGKDFADFYRNAIVKEFYRERAERGSYGKEHAEMVRLWGK